MVAAEATEKRVAVATGDLVAGRTRVQGEDGGRVGVETVDEVAMHDPTKAGTAILDRAVGSIEVVVAVVAPGLVTAPAGKRATTLTGRTARTVAVAVTGLVVGTGVVVGVAAMGKAVKPAMGGVVTDRVGLAIAAGGAAVAGAAAARSRLAGRPAAVRGRPRSPAGRTTPTRRRSVR